MNKVIHPREVYSTPYRFYTARKFRLFSLFIILGMILVFPAKNSFAIPNPAPSQPDPVLAEINIVAWVYLEGAMIDPKGTRTYSLPMRTTLNDLHLLPGQTRINFLTGNMYIPAGQPYNMPPWSYDGTEGEIYNSSGNPDPGSANYAPTVVDWIHISIRETPDGIPLCTKAALLHNDGHVEMVEGGLICNPGNSYYLVIEHRNHLIVMSSQPVSVIDGALTYDFRYSQGYVENNGNDSYGQKELLPDLPGVYALYAGNGDQSESSYSDTDINFDDRTFWGMMNGMHNQYCNGDYNMSGDTNWLDLITWGGNNGIFSTVPRD
jgi:hypothetical protein